jgi:SRSO17 transposase
VGFATKPQLAQRMIERAITAQIPFGWVAGDEVYAGNGPLRTWLEQQQIRYVLAVACDHRVPAGAGRTLRADELAARLPARAWQRLSAGNGAKGQRWYDWAWITVRSPEPGCRWLLIRRNRRTGELALYRCHAPHLVPLAMLVKVAGLRWTVEENFQASKGPDRPGRAPGPPLDLLAPVGHPGHARRRVPGHRRRPRTRPQPRSGRADPADPQRDRASARHHRLPAA